MTSSKEDLSLRPPAHTNDPISSRYESGDDSYASSVFMPTSVRIKINNLIKEYDIDIRQTIGVGRGRGNDIWADEVELIGNLESLSFNFSKSQESDFAQFKKVVQDQQKYFDNNGTYKVFVIKEKPHRTSYFLNNGFHGEDDY